MLTAPISSGAGVEQSTMAAAPAQMESTSCSAAAGAQFRLADPRSLPPLGDSAGGAEIWEIASTEDAGSLLSGCPHDSIICCAFSAPHADGMRAQAAAMQELAAAQPAGFVFAAVDMAAAPDVASWAGVTSPGVLLLHPDGRLLEEVKHPALGQGALHTAVLGHAAVTARAAVLKLEALAQRFPKALTAEVPALAVGADVEKMRQNGLATLERCDAGSEGRAEAFETLCRCCEGAGRTARVRDLASLARSLRDVPPENAMPLLDLSRRLASRRLLGGGEPGAREALELLLDASLRCSLDTGVWADEASLPAALNRAALALQVAGSCFTQDALREALLPVAGQVVRTEGWTALWRTATGDGTGAVRARDSAATLLLGASVALRTARCRVEHRCLLDAAIDALHRVPSNERLSLAVGNLLAVGGNAQDAKRALQAQPLPSLRALAAALYRSDLHGPDGSAFPEAWQPAGSGSDAGGNAGDGPATGRRPPRGPIPARAMQRLRRGG